MTNCQKCRDLTDEVERRADLNARAALLLGVYAQTGDAAAYAQSEVASEDAALRHQSAARVLEQHRRVHAQHSRS